VGSEMCIRDRYAYDDSAGDRELLAWADHPTWIDADPLPRDFTA